MNPLKTSLIIIGFLVFSFVLINPSQAKAAIEYSNSTINILNRNTPDNPELQAAEYSNSTIEILNSISNNQATTFALSNDCIGTGKSGELYKVKIEGITQGGKLLYRVEIEDITITPWSFANSEAEPELQAIEYSSSTINILNRNTPDNPELQAAEYSNSTIEILN